MYVYMYVCTYVCRYVCRYVCVQTPCVCMHRIADSSSEAFILMLYRESNKVGV